MSWAESIANSLSAYLLGVFANLIVLPAFGLYPQVGDALIIAAIFFVISVLRNVAWRRYFENQRGNHDSDI